jgi:hypothetical protein
MRIATLLSAVLMAGAATPAVATAAPSSTIRERTVVRGSSALTIGPPLATSDHLAWLESSKAGTRVAVKTGPRIRRSGWKRRVNRFALRRGVDAQTGMVAVRVELSHCRASGECTLRSTLDPRSLRRSLIRWAPEPEQGDYWYGKGAGSIVDGATQLTYRDTPEARPPGAAEAAYAELMAPTGCDLRDASQAVTIPVLHDCGSMAVVLRNGLVAVRADVPSRTLSDHYSTQRRLDVLDLNVSGASWRAIGSGGYSKGGSYGVQAFCLLDDAIAVLTGQEAYYDGSPANTWRLAVIPLRAGGASWQAAAPQLVEADAWSLACTSRGIYTRARKSGNLVQILPPKAEASR